MTCHLDPMHEPLPVSRIPMQRIYRHRQRLVEERQAKEAKAAGRPWPPPGVAGQKTQQPAHHGTSRLHPQ